MKTYNFYFLSSVIFIWMVNVVYATIIEDYYYVSIRLPLNIADENDPEYDQYMNNVADEIRGIILKYKDDYINQEKLNENDIVYPSGVRTVLAYLCPNTLNNLQYLSLITSIKPKTQLIPENINNNGDLPYKEDFYIIATENPYANLDVRSNEDHEEFIDNINYSIYEIIMNNKNTYENVEKINEIINNQRHIRAEPLIGLGLSYYIYDVEDHVYFYAYLNTKLLNKVKALPYITNIMENSNENENEIEEPKLEQECKTIEIGYPCCPPNITKVLYQDENGDWSYDFEKNEWCGIIPQKKNNDECLSLTLGYSCCSRCDSYVTTDDNIKWGVENNEWCGIKSNC